MSEQTLIIRFRYGKADLEPLYELEEKVAEAVEEADAGEYDGHEMAMDSSEGYLYLVGPDARQLLEVVEPVLARARFMRGAEATMRFGSGDDAEEDSVIIGG